MFNPTDEKPVFVTSEAEDYITQAVEASGVNIIRLGAVQACCQTFCSLEFSTALPEDIVLKYDKFRLVLGKEDVQSLYGAVIALDADGLAVEMYVDGCLCSSSDCGGCEDCTCEEEE